MLKQLHPLFLKTCTWFACSLIIMSAATAFGIDTDAASSSPPTASRTDQKFEERVKQFIGIPYRSGGTTIKGLDCSGFVRLIYDQIFGIALPHSSMAQFKFSGLKKIDKQDLQPGDLIFFGNKEKKRINHVGVYLSDNRFIHASSSDGIRVSGLNERYWQKRFMGTRRHEDLISGFSKNKNLLFVDQTIQNEEYIQIHSLADIPNI